MSLPFTEGFEAATTPVAGDLDGQNRWETSSPGRIVVQTADKNSGAQAIKLMGGDETATAEHLIGAVQEQIVWIDLYSKIDPSTITHFGDHPDIERVSDYLPSVFAMNNHGDIYAYNGLISDWQKVTTTPITDGTYHRYTVRQDYGIGTWDLYIDAVLQVSGLGFRNSNIVEFFLFSMTGTRGGNSYCDAITIGTTKPVGIP